MLESKSVSKWSLKRVEVLKSHIGPLYASTQRRVPSLTFSKNFAPPSPLIKRYVTLIFLKTEQGVFIIQQIPLCVDMAPPHLQPRAKPAIRRRSRTAARPIDPYPFNDQLPPLPQFYEKTFKSGAKVTLKNLPASDEARKMGKATFWDEYEKPKQQALTNYANNPAHFEWNLQHGFIVTVTADRMVLTVRQASHKLLLRYLITPQKCLKDGTRMWMGQPSGPKADMPHAWWAGQCIHFGLPVDSDVNDMKASLLEAIEHRTLAVPPLIQGLRLLRKTEAGDTRPCAPHEIQQLDETSNIKFESSDSESEHESDGRVLYDSDADGDSEDSYRDEGTMEDDDDLGDDAAELSTDEESTGSDILKVREPKEHYRKLKENAEIARANKAPRKKLKPSHAQHSGPAPAAAQQSDDSDEASADRQASRSHLRTKSRHVNVEVVVPATRAKSNRNLQNPDTMQQADTGLLSPVTSSPFTPDTVRILDSRQQKHKSAVELGNQEEPPARESHIAPRAGRKTAKKMFTDGANESSRRVPNETTVRGDKQHHEKFARGANPDFQTTTRKSTKGQRQICIDWPVIDTRHGHFGPPVRMPNPPIAPIDYAPDHIKFPNLRIKVEKFLDQYPGCPVTWQDAGYLIEQRNGDIFAASKDLNKFILEWKRQRPWTGVRVNRDGSLTYPGDQAGTRRAATSAQGAGGMTSAPHRGCPELDHPASKRDAILEHQTGSLECTSEAANNSGPIEAEESRNDVIYSAHGEFYESIRPPVALEMAASGVKLPIYAPTPRIRKDCADTMRSDQRENIGSHLATTGAQSHASKQPQRAKPVSAKKRKLQDTEVETSDAALNGEKPSKKAKRSTKSKEAKDHPNAVQEDVVMKDSKQPATSHTTCKHLAERPKRSTKKTSSHPNNDQQPKESSISGDNAREDNANNAASTTLSEAFKQRLQLDGGTDQTDAATQAEAALSKGFFSPAREAQLRNKVFRHTSTAPAPDPDTEMRDVNREDGAGKLDSTRKLKSPKGKSKRSPSTRKKVTDNMPATSLDEESSDDSSDSSSGDSDSLDEGVYRYALKVFKPDLSKPTPKNVPFAKQMRKARNEHTVAYLRHNLTDEQICALHAGDETLGIRVEDHVLGNLGKLAMTPTELRDFQENNRQNIAKTRLEMQKPQQDTPDGGSVREGSEKKKGKGKRGGK